MNKRGRKGGKAVLQKETVDSDFQSVAFGIIGPLPSITACNHYILSIEDYYTKWAEAYELLNHNHIPLFLSMPLW